MFPPSHGGEDNGSLVSSFTTRTELVTAGSTGGGVGGGGVSSTTWGAQGSEGDGEAGAVGTAQTVPQQEDDNPYEKVRGPLMAV